jgi:hypothetical protein
MSCSQENEIIGSMKKSARTPHRRPWSSSSRIRGGGAAAALAGVSYGAWGYLDRPVGNGYVLDAVLHVLAVITPALFLGGIVGLYSRLWEGGSHLWKTGLLLGLLGSLLGTMFGMVDGLVWLLTPAQHVGGWRILLGSGWWVLLFASLTVVGVVTLIEGPLRLLGALVLTSGTLGWLSLFTDPAFPGVVLSMRAAHVAFAALFCLSAVVWGSVLFRRPHSFVPRPP